MRKGHRRTQSATLALSALQQTTSFQPPLPLPLNNKVEVATLLTKSSSKIKDKICQVESLNVNSNTDQLFNFGKGFLKKKGEKIEKERKEQCLIVIPEKMHAEPKRQKQDNISDQIHLQGLNQFRHSIKRVEKQSIFRQPFAQNSNKIVKQVSKVTMKLKIKRGELLLKHSATSQNLPWSQKSSRY